MTINHYKENYSFDTFIEKELYKEIDGWLDLGVFKTLKHISQFQKQNNINGAVCEIGVHHGKFFIPLSLLRTKDEKALVIDVFENQKLNVDQSGKGDLQILNRNLEKYTNNHNIEICKSDSMLLSADDIVKNTGGQRIKLFSVDGSHSLDHTVNDLMLAQDSIVPGGIIIMDDFYSQRWPTVMEGIHRFFMLSPYKKVAPIAYGNNKLYLTTHSHRRDYFNYLFEYCTDYIKKIEVSLWNYRVLFIRY